MTGVKCFLLAVTLVSQTLNVNGVQRTYLVGVPAKRSPMPLVLVFHGGGGRGRGMVRLTGFDDLADRYGFVVVYPDGLRRQWNDGRLPFNNGADDVAFVSALIDRIAQDYPIDRKRVYATGMSNGAMFSQRLGCELADRIAAIAPVSGNMPSALAPTCRPARPVSVIEINGTDDPLVPFAGGNVISPRMGTVLSSPDTVAFWAKVDGCRHDPTSTALPAIAPPDGTSIVREVFGGCRAGTAVTFYRVNGGGHTWPQGLQYLPRSIIGPASRQLDASDTIVRFFLAHEMR